MNNQLNNTILHLSLIDGVGPATIAAIIEHKPSALPWLDLYGQTASDLQQQFGLGERMAQKVVAGLGDTALLARELELLEAHALSCITIDDERYPALLRTIHVPPAVLYVQGNTATLSLPMLAIVGSREADSYAQSVIEHFVPMLGQAGWAIASGGALGADGMAHRTALAQGIPTIAVLGSGLLRWYPREHHALFDQIIACGGALISPFSLTTPPSAGNFPARNRIIAGISRGVLVVQAAAKSGAKITAEYALQQSREVFAVPGRIDHPLSAGCHELIQMGAKLVASPADVLIEFGQTGHEIIPVACQPISTPSRSVQKTVDIVDVTDQSPRARVLRVCTQPVTVDDIIMQSKLPLAVVQEELFNLQLDGMLAQDFTGMWRRVF